MYHISWFWYNNDSKLETQKKEILKETKEYFEFYTAKLYKDFLGMTQDDIQILKEKNEDHGQRITNLEQEVEALTIS